MEISRDLGNFISITAGFSLAFIAAGTIYFLMTRDTTKDKKHPTSNK